MPILTNSAFEKNIEDYIVVYDDVLKSDFCDGVVAEFAEEEWRSTQVDESARVDRRIRNADAVSLSTPDVIQKNLGVRKKIEDTLFTACAGILRRYHARFPHSAVVEGMGFELLRYSPGGYYRVHTDSFKRVPRSLACSFTLNNDFEGGEWSSPRGLPRVRGVDPGHCVQRSPFDPKISAPLHSAKLIVSPPAQQVVSAHSLPKQISLLDPSAHAHS